MEIRAEFIQLLLQVGRIMIPYIFLILSVIILTVVDYKTKHSFTNKLFIFAFIILLLFAGFRGSGDGDYNVYKYLFSQFTHISDLFKRSHIEPGFRILAIILNKMKLGSQSIIFVMNLVSISSIFYIIKKYSKNRMLSILAFLPFYFMFDMQSARSAVSIGLTMVGYSFLLEEKNGKYTVFIILASLFHLTALVSVLVVPLYSYFKKETRIDIKRIILVLVVILAIGLSIRYFDLIGNFVMLLNNDFLTTKYNWYIKSPYTYPYSLLDPRFIFSILQFIFYSMMIDKSNRTMTFLYITLILTIITTFLFSTFTILVIRLGSYFTIYSILIVPEIYEFVSQTILSFNIKILKKIGKDSIKRILLLCYVLIYLLYLYGVLNGYYTYKLFLKF